LEEWLLGIAFIKWISSERMTRRRLLKALRDHQIGGLRFLEAVRADTVLLLRKPSISCREIAALMENVIAVELKARAVVIVKDVLELENIIRRGREIIERSREAQG